MATLTEISFYTRKGLVWTGIALVIIMLIPVTVSTSKSIYLKLNPPPPPPPTVRYGKLPALIFPSTPGGKPTFTLQTIQGGLPKLPNVGKVYLVGINKSRLLELDRAKQRARILGFTNDPVSIDDLTYKFTHPTLAATLVVNLVSGGFSYQYNYLKDKPIFVPALLPTTDQAGGLAREFLTSLGQLPDDLAAGTAKSVYEIATYSGQMVESPSYSLANMVRVDLYRQDKDGLNVVTAGGNSSPVNALITGSSQINKKVVSANYQYSSVVGNDFATYPLETVDQAWAALNAGKGYVNQNIPNAVIRKVSLGYYESNDPQEFLQLVFVFSGDGGVQALVQAVDPRYISGSN